MSDYTTNLNLAIERSLNNSKPELNVGNIKPIDSLELYFSDRNKYYKIKNIVGEYGNWRKIKGDGNCYFRCIGFGIIESILKMEYFSNDQIDKFKKLSLLIEKVKNNDNEDMINVFYNLISINSESFILYKSNPLQNFIDEIQNPNLFLDISLIICIRLIISNYIINNLNLNTKLNLTILEIINSYGKCTNEYIEDIERLGEDAKDIIIELNILPNLLNIKTGIICLFDEVKVKTFDNNSIDFYLVLNKGHYFIIYPSI